MIAQQLFWGVLLTLANVVFHIIGLVHLGRLLPYMMPDQPEARDSPRRVLFLSLSVLILITLHLVEAAGWALLYLRIGELDDFQGALYFSVVTATTLGYGDLTLSEPWRLLGLFEAMTGLMLFGASTAAVFQLMVRTLPDPFERASRKGLRI